MRDPIKTNPLDVGTLRGGWRRAESSAVFSRRPPEERGWLFSPTQSGGLQSQARCSRYRRHSYVTAHDNTGNMASVMRYNGTRRVLDTLYSLQTGLQGATI